MAYEPDAKGGRLDSRQHCGGVLPPQQSREDPVLPPGEGSLEESRYYWILAQDLGYGSTEPLLNPLDEVSRLLHAYVKVILASWDFKGGALGYC